MKTLARLLRKAGFILILVVAAFAVGVTGHFLPITRERYQNKGISTEQVDANVKMTNRILKVTNISS
ncbi:MAG TPA: hypothetical protein PKX08_01785 [Cyclobacteriaceae bacterium]|nr:hypothetical protein [Cyclobacteriaceae bacterium]